MFSQKQRERELADEMESHLQMHIEDKVRSGMTEEQARRDAILKLGGMEATKEAWRERSTVPFLEQSVQDARFGVRQLMKNPGFAGTTILIWALGIGASTAIFSAVNPILFEPLPYPHPERLVMIWETRSDGPPLDASFGSYRGLLERNRSFESLAVMKPWQPTMTSATEPERLEGQRVSAQYFRALGLSPVLGRDFQPADDTFKGPNVVVLGDQLWRRRLGADSAIVGQQVTLDDNLYTVIGVMPSGFENVLNPSAQLWAPLQYDTSLPWDGREWGHHLRMVGRLRPGVGGEQAMSELNVILHVLAQTYARGYDSSGGAPRSFLVNSLQSDITRAVRPALLAVLGAVLLLLAIACVNVTNILLARGAQRRGEFVMRATLGAKPTRLIRQLLTESVLLAIAGGALGMMVAQAGVRALVALSPPELPRVGAIRVDGIAFGFGMGIATLTGLLVGVIPALHASHGDLHVGLQQSSLRTTGRHQWTRRTLVVSEVALALVLLVSAGLLLRSLQRLFAIAPGFDASHLLTMQVQTSGRRFDDNATHRFFDQALQAVQQVPGVTRAGFTSQLPLSGDFESYGLQLAARPNESFEPGFRYAVSTEYFKTMGIPLRLGRLLDERDGKGAPGAVLVSESFAKRKFSGENPIGQRVHVGPDIGHADRPWQTIVGVVGDVKQASLAVNEPDAIYTTPWQWSWADSVRSLVVRTQGDAASMAPAIRQAIWSVDKDQPIVRVATMDNLLTASEAERRFALILFEAFALVALVLAATGIYGLLSGSVVERMREIGVRSALGASRMDIVGLVVRQGMTLTALGVVLGLSGAVVASRALITLLFGVSRLDPVTYVGVIAMLLGVSGIACWVPAWRAARVGPLISLRAE
jgi:putative ABC transport system permease protein